MRRVLVTGGAGFIGSALCRHLIAETDVDILNVDVLTYAGNLASLREIDGNPRHRFVCADIRDRARMDALFAEFQPDAIMHLAAETHVDRSIDCCEPFITTNILGTFTLLEAARLYWRLMPEAAREAFRFLHVSTDEVYGSLGPDSHFTEETCYDPSSPYAASKAAADHLASAWQRTYGLPVIISNCSNNYGPYQFPEKLIPLVILNALERKPLPVYGQGANVRDWLNVEDHARALVALVAHGRPGETYNIGARSERRNIDVVRAICRLLDTARPGASHEDLITFVTDRPCHDARYAIDPTKIETELGWHPRETFETGLARTIEWYLANESWWAPLRRGVYGGERLGLQAAS